MIFICVGSREYQFNRLLKEIDILIEKKIIKDEVYAQIGQSTYIPKHYKYIRYMGTEEFMSNQKEADIIISHGGTGALVGALKMHKQVIAVPRLAEYNEHIDNHQLQVSTELEKKQYLKCVVDIKKLGNIILELKDKPIQKKFKSESKVIEVIEEYLEGVFNE